MIKHKLRTKNKQLVLKLYNFDEIRIKEDIIQKLISVIKLNEKLFNVVFNVIDCVRDVFLKYLWLRDHNSIINWAKRTISWKRLMSVTKKTKIRKKQKNHLTYIVEITWLQLKETVAAIEEILSQYSIYQEIFKNSKKNILLSKHKTWDHAINLKSETQLISESIYSLSKIENKILRIYIKKQRSKKYIKSFTSLTEYSIFFVKKSNESLRSCVNYRKLNAIIVENRYSISLCKKIFNNMSRARWYTQLNLRNAFNLICIREEDEWKTAFKTRYELFEYQMMSFELINVSTTFQKIINEILRKYLNVFVIAYLNDILIYFNTKEEHEQHVRKVLKKLKKAELKVKLKKSRFHAQEIKFLEFIIRHNQIRMNSEKIRTITDWLRLIKIKDILALAEFANFYRDFIKSFFEIMHSLNKLLKKDRQWEWEIEQENAFQTLKKKFVEKSILKIFDDEKQTVIEINASNYVISTCVTMLMRRQRYRWDRVLYI